MRSRPVAVVDAIWSAGERTTGQLCAWFALAAYLGSNRFVGVGRGAGYLAERVVAHLASASELVASGPATQSAVEPAQTGPMSRIHG